MRRNKTFGGLLLIILIFFVFVGTYFCIQFSMNAYLQSIDISKISNDSANPILVSVPSQNFGYVTINEIDQWKTSPMFRQYIKTYVNSCAVGINDIDGLDFNIKPANNANINLIETNDLFVTKISSNGENTSVKIQNTADIYMKALPYLAGPSIASLGNLFDNKINNIPDFYLASSTLDQTKIEFNQILNDCDLNLAVMNKLKQVNANVNYNDFILEIKKITTLNANQQIYKLYLSAIANNNDIKINGVWNFSIVVKVFLPVGVQFDLSTIDTSKITTPFVSAVTVDDVKSVTTSEIASASDDNNLRIAILDYIRRFSPYSLVNDFSISVYSDFTNFNNVTFTNDCYIRISASDDSNTLSNSVVVPLALTVNEPIISNTYRASLVANYNLTGSTIFNLHGHANVAVRITTIDISFKWSKARNLIKNNINLNLFDEINNGVITNFSARWGGGSYIDVDLDSTAELLAKDEHTNLAGFPSIAPIINNRKYLFGSRRNGEQILANFQFESQTSPKNPPANTPSIWLTDRLSPNNRRINGDYFWNAIDLSIDNNYVLRSCVDSQNNLFRYYLSALDSSRDFSFNSNVINESTFSIFTGNNV